MKVWAHCLVRNEARFCWFAVMSVLPFVEKVLLWDTGSTDSTVEILKEIKRREKSKVDLNFVGKISAEEFALVRQAMFDVTLSDWFLVVDGDEVWWDRSVEKVIRLIGQRGDEMEAVVVPTYNLVGDVFHYQEEAAGRYRLAGRLGQLSLRGVNRRIPGLASAGAHGVWGWVDGSGKMIQDREKERIVYAKAPYLHATHLLRAGSGGGEAEVPKRKGKLKYELGVEFSRDFYYPEVFFRGRPAIVETPWVKMNSGYKVRALFATPLRKIKRRVWKKGVGY